MIHVRLDIIYYENTFEALYRRRTTGYVGSLYLISNVYRSLSYEAAYGTALLE